MSVLMRYEIYPRVGGTTTILAAVKETKFFKEKKNRCKRGPDKSDFGVIFNSNVPESEHVMRPSVINSNLEDGRRRS